MPSPRQTRARRWAHDVARLARASEAERRQILRHYFFRAARNQTSVVLAELGEFPFFVSTRDTVISRAVFTTGSFDLAAMDQILGTIAHDLTTKSVLDIGANLGTTTVNFVRRYNAARVIAIEADASNYRLLQHNILENDIADRVTAHRVAASDREGLLPFLRNDGHWGGNQIASAGDQVDGRIQVPAIRIDDLLERSSIPVEGIGLMWMDVQGHEVHVLAGAAQVRAAAVPIVMEFDPPALRAAGRFDDLYDLVAPYYTRVLDFGSPHALPRHIVRTLAIGDLGRLAQDYGSEGFSDIAFLP